MWPVPFNKWRGFFIEGRQERLTEGPATSREREPEKENEELNQALGESLLSGEFPKRLQSLPRIGHEKLEGIRREETFSVSR